MKKSKIIGLSLGIVAATASTVTTPLLITSCSKEDQTNNGTGNNNSSDQSEKEIFLSLSDIKKISDRICSIASGVTKNRFIQANNDLNEHNQIKTAIVKNLNIDGFNETILGVVEVGEKWNGDLWINIYNLKGFVFKPEKGDWQFPPYPNPIGTINFQTGYRGIRVKVQFGDYIKIPINSKEKRDIVSQISYLASTMKGSEVNSRQKDFKIEASKNSRIKKEMIESVNPIKTGRNYNGIELIANSQYKFTNDIIDTYANENLTISNDGQKITISNLNFLAE